MIARRFTQLFSGGNVTKLQQTGTAFARSVLPMRGYSSQPDAISKQRKVLSVILSEEEQQQLMDYAAGFKCSYAKNAEAYDMAHLNAPENAKFRKFGEMILHHTNIICKARTMEDLFFYGTRIFENILGRHLVIHSEDDPMIKSLESKGLDKEGIAELLNAPVELNPNRETEIVHLNFSSGNDYKDLMAYAANFSLTETSKEADLEFLNAPGNEKFKAVGELLLRYKNAVSYPDDQPGNGLAVLEYILGKYVHPHFPGDTPSLEADFTSYGMR